MDGIQTANHLFCKQQICQLCLKHWPYSSLHTTYISGGLTVSTYSAASIFATKWFYSKLIFLQNL